MNNETPEKMPPDGRSLSKRIVDIAAVIAAVGTVVLVLFPEQSRANLPSYLGSGIGLLTAFIRSFWIYLAVAFVIALCYSQWSLVLRLSSPVRRLLRSAYVRGLTFLLRPLLDDVARPSKLRIVRAQYGARGKFADVKGVLQSRVIRDELRLIVTNENLGLVRREDDPIYGTAKLLTVEFTFLGLCRTMKIPEYQLLELDIEQMERGAGRRTGICFGERVVFKHCTTGHYLTSLSGQVFARAAGGSGQQTTFGAAIPDENAIWTIRREYGRPETEDFGQEIKVDHIIRIVHEATNQCLHSHSTASPNSRAEPIDAQQHEVTVATGSNVQDNWHVAELRPFDFGVKWRFRHSDGQLFLHSHTRLLSVSGRSGCFEVTCCRDRNEDDFWIVLPLSEIELV